MNLKIKRNYNSSTLVITPDFKPFGIVLFVTFILTGSLVVFYQTIEGLISGSIPLLFLIFLVPFFWGIYTNFFNFYWLTIGDEEIEMNKDFIRISRKIKILKKSKRYSRIKISDIELVEMSNNFGASGYAMLGLSNVHVLFKYGRKKHMIGKQIERYEAEQIIEELKHWGYTT